MMHDFPMWTGGANFPSPHASYDRPFATSALIHHSVRYNVPRFMPCRMQDAAPRAPTPPATRTRSYLGRYMTIFYTSPRGRIGIILKPRSGPRQTGSLVPRSILLEENVVPPRGRLKYTTRSLSLLMIGPRTPELGASNGGCSVLRTAAKSRGKPPRCERTRL